MSSWPASVAILGAGALGTLLAYQLKRHTAVTVWLLARSAHPGSVQLVGADPVPVPVLHPGERSDSHSVALAAPCDLLIVTVKAYDTAEAVCQAAPLTGPATIGLTLQNGLGNAEVLAAHLGADRVLAGATAQGATLLQPGLVRHAGGGETQVAPWAPGGPAVRRAPAIAALLQAAGIATTVQPEAGPLLWRKVTANCAINPLTALLRVTNGELLQIPGAVRILEAAAREAGTVAAAAGIHLPGDPAAEARAIARATAANRSSMLQDLERGRRTEIAALNGAIVEAGRRFGVPTPVNETLTLLVQAAEEGAPVSGALLGLGL